MDYFVSPIETERLIIRPVGLDDAEDMFDYARFDEVGRPCGWPFHTSIEETREIITQVFLNNPEQAALVEKASGKMIGTLGILSGSRDRRNERSCMIGYVLNPLYWGKGYVPEAVRALINRVLEGDEFDVIAAHVHTDNPQSCRVLEKLGFVREGILRQAVRIYDGTVYDEFVYSILREEWPMDTN